MDHESASSSSSEAEAEAEAETESEMQTRQAGSHLKLPNLKPQTLEERRRQLREAKPRPTVVISSHRGVPAVEKPRKRSRSKSDDGVALHAEFTFEENAFGSDEEVDQSWDFEKAIRVSKQQAKPSQRFTTSLKEKIESALAKSKSKVTTAQADEEEEEQEQEEEEEEDEEEEEKENEKKAKERMKKVDKKVDELKMKMKKEKGGRKKGKAVATSFSELNLSRPLLKAVRSLGFEKPTPIQGEAMPFILQGRDVCGSAVTGSGKTAAYLLPVLERLLFRPKQVNVIRVLVLTPTRELAQQVLSMLEKLARFTDVEAMSVVGGLSLQAQASRLRGRPGMWSMG